MDLAQKQIEFFELSHQKTPNMTLVESVAKIGEVEKVIVADGGRRSAYAEQLQMHPCQGLDVEGSNDGLRNCRTRGYQSVAA